MYHIISHHIISNEKFSPHLRLRQFPMIRDFYQTKSPPVGRSYSWVCHCPKDEENSWDEPQRGICRLLNPERRALAAPSQSVVSFKHQTRHGQGGGNPGQVLRQPGGWVSGKTELQTGQRHRLPWRPPQLFRRSWAGTATPSQSFLTVLVGPELFQSDWL